MLRNLFLAVPFLLLAHVTSAVALPECNGDYTGPCYDSVVWPNGMTYAGEIRDGKYNGQGTATWPDGSKYVGEWRNSKQHGQGTKTFPNGDKYIGQSEYDLMNGRGTYTYYNGEEYTGEFSKGLFHGRGTYTELDGSRYTGEWRAGHRNGEGVLVRPNGDEYTGEFRNDGFHGQGKYVVSKKSGHSDLEGRSVDGLEIHGEYRDSLPYEDMVLIWPNGDVWLGLIGFDEDGAKWFGGNRYIAGNVPPEVYTSIGREPPRSVTNTPPQPELTETDSSPPTPTTTSRSMSIDRAKEECEELGFEPKTEKFGECVLSLTN